MKIQIVQSKLLEILNYLYVDGLFPFAIITTKDGKLVSSQSDKIQDKGGFAYRFVQFSPDYFKEISQQQETIKIDVEKVKGFTSLRKPDDIMTLEYPSPTAANKLLISGGGAKNNIAIVKVDEQEIKLGLPFEMKEKVPYIQKGEVPLDTHVVMSLSSFRTIDAYASKHGTEFYKYHIGKDRKLKVTVGDIHGFEDSTDIEPTCQVLAVNEEVNVIFTKGIKEITKVFSHDVDICMRSNLPAWFSEISQSIKFGVMISPYLKKDE